MLISIVVVVIVLSGTKEDGQPVLWIRIVRLPAIGPHLQAIVASRGILVLVKLVGINQVHVDIDL